MSQEEFYTEQQQQPEYKPGYEPDGKKEKKGSGKLFAYGCSDIRHNISSVK